MQRWLLAILLLVPARAEAAARAPEPAPVPLPSVRVDGPAVVSEAAVVVHCSSLDLIEASTRCEVETSFLVTPTTEAPVSIVAVNAETATLQVNGDASWDRLEPGISHRVRLSFQRTLAIHTEHREDFLVLVPIRVRHLLLGESSGTTREGDGAYGPLIEGDASLVGTVRVEVEAPDEVTVNLGGEAVAGERVISVSYPSLTLALTAPPHDASVLQHGGPVLSLGASFAFEDEAVGAEEARFLLRGSYEVGIADYVITSIGFESDFHSIMESVVVEVATPELLVLLPSLSGGVGVVARQLGNRDADVALRLRLGFNIVAVGLTVDFDYWPSVGQWTSSIAARISL